MELKSLLFEAEKRIGRATHISAPFLLAICVGFVVYGSFNVISVSQYILYFFAIGIAGGIHKKQSALD